MRNETGGGSAGSNAATRERPRDTDAHRLVGERAPVWLAALLALLGTALSLVASALWLEQRPFSAPDWTRLDASRWAMLDAWRRELLPAPSAPQQEQPKPAEPTEALQQSAPAPIAEPEPAIVATTPQQPAAEAAANETAEPDGRGAEPEQREEAGAVSCLPVAVIPFARNSARVNPAGQEQTVAILSRWLIENPDAVLLVEGHSDTSGPEQYNVLLSYSRAKAVTAWLKGSGVPERQMIARAAGSNYAKDVPEGAGSNRRVVVRVEGVASCR
jgi:outer membrane protein OmpA-like peptidoglycan-associated protein